ncbi:MAG: TolC family protein, partial [Bacteroidaceae bacterium]|nr:TolC family protein [Bacteroidaceae bacterium]
RHGTAAESDWLSVRAERLNTVQELSSLESQRATLSRMLSLFCGLEVTRPMKPETAADALVPNDGDGSLRPEVQFLDRQLQLTDARERLLDKALRPRLTLFAQGFYGYPGYNLFEDMTHRNGSWNGIVGARLSWNIGALYTYRNDKARLEAERNSSRMQRDVFLFNNRLESTQHSEETARFRRMMAEDDEIVSLRRAVRLAAESKLAHGIIDVNDLLREINAENSAMVRRAIHEIEMLRELHSLRTTLNR